MKRNRLESYEWLRSDVQESQDTQASSSQKDSHGLSDKTMVSVRKFLMVVFLNALCPVNVIYQKCGFSVELGNRIKNQSIAKALVEETRVQLESGRGKSFNCLFLTDSGHAFIDVPKDVLKGHGGTLHQLFQQHLSLELKARDLPSKIEFMHEGKAVDLGLRFKGLLCALEVVVSTVHLEHQNLIKDIEAGFDRVYFIAKDARVKKQVEKTIQTQCDENMQRKARVGFMFDFIKEVERSNTE